MVGKYEVLGYIPVAGDYQYIQFYTGQSLIKAVLIMRKLKKQRVDYVRLEWG